MHFEKAFYFYWLLMTCGNKNWWQCDSLTACPDSIWVGRAPLVIYTCCCGASQHDAGNMLLAICYCNNWAMLSPPDCCCCWYCLISTRWSIGHMEKYFQRDCQMLISSENGARLKKKRSATAIWNWLGKRAQRERSKQRRGEKDMGGSSLRQRLYYDSDWR